MSTTNQMPPGLPSDENSIVYVARLMFERHLTDIAGGNVSCRQDDQILITPTGAGMRQHWQLDPADIISAPIADDSLLDDPRHSNESISHLLVYRAFPQVGAIIHAHPQHVLPFCAIEKPIPAVIKSAQVYADSFEFIGDAPGYSREQGELIVTYFETCDPAKLDNFAWVVLMPQHGIFIAAPDLRRAIDCLDRMNTNAWCNIALTGLQAP